MQVTAKINDGFGHPFSDEHLSAAGDGSLIAAQRAASRTDGQAGALASRGTMIAAVLIVAATAAMVSTAVSLAPSCHGSDATTTLKIGGTHMAGCTVAALRE